VRPFIRYLGYSPLVSVLVATTTLKAPTLAPLLLHRQMREHRRHWLLALEKMVGASQQEGGRLHNALWPPVVLVHNAAVLSAMDHLSELKHFCGVSLCP
jgi:hypothetical protein